MIIITISLSCFSYLFWINYFVLISDNGKKLLNDLGETFSFDKYVADVWNALLIYAQMGHHLGWPHIMKVLR